MRQARCVNVRVIGLKEGAPLDENAQTIGKMFEYTKALPITKTWSVGCDTTRKRALVLQIRTWNLGSYFLRRDHSSRIRWGPYLSK